ncbi:MAG: BrnT family toxin [Acidobacteriota bacterium]
MQFSWDPDKASRNERKHGVAFQEALTVFSDSLARIHDDPDHSKGELREIIVGQSRSGRLLLVCFTERAEGIRLFSARETTRHERRDYEQAR